MAIPDYQSLMLPLLNLIQDGNEYSINDLVNGLANHFKLAPDEIDQMLPSGTEAVFRNRVRWARFYLLRALLLEDPKRGIVRISKRGTSVLSSRPSAIDVKFLEQFAEFAAFKGSKKAPAHDASLEGEKTPEELIADGYAALRSDIQSELLSKVLTTSAKFFEHLVVELLVRLGYGGALENPGTVTGKTGDEGIDGVIKEDKLGLEFIYIQAKRWENSVGREEVQKFVGALHGKKARKGVFITTSTFSKSARDYVHEIGDKVVLIDGAKLVQLMFETDLGVASVTSIHIKKIDQDYFSEEQPVQAQSVASGS